MSMEDTAAEAWLYFYPLLVMQATRAAEPDLRMNAWHHAEALRSHDFKDVIRPNVDTLYSHAWLDLRNGPVELSVPATDGRYYVVQAMDEWSLTFATVGTRTTGDGPGRFVFAPPGDATAREGATVIESPTSFVWLLLRIENDGPADAAPIQKLQSDFRLHGGAHDDAPPSRLIPEIEGPLKEGTPPPRAVMALEAQAFFRWACSLWGAPGIGIPEGDGEFITRVAPLRLQPGAPFDWDELSDPQRSALDAAKPRALRKLATEAVQEGGANEDGWYYLRDNWYRVEGHHVLQQQPTNYTLRTALALEALGFLPLQEAAYLSAGVPRVGGDVLSGADGASYAIRFPAGKLPPVDAFWSLAVYDDAGYLIDNPIGRYNLGSKDALEPDPDGAVTVRLSAARPDGPNWLPIPPGPFSVTFRAYCSTEPIVHGGNGWKVPPVQPL